MGDWGPLDWFFAVVFVCLTWLAILGTIAVTISAWKWLTGRD